MPKRRDVSRKSKNRDEASTNGDARIARDASAVSGDHGRICNSNKSITPTNRPLQDKLHWVLFWPTVTHTSSGFNVVLRFESAVVSWNTYSSTQTPGPKRNWSTCPFCSQGKKVLTAQLLEQEEARPASIASYQQQ